MSRAKGNADEWFDHPDPATGAPGLRFACTMCGNCCSGPTGYVAFTDDEAHTMASKLGLSLEQFMDRYTHQTPVGLSLREVPGSHGLDCVFLDRTTIPGRAICAVYEARPSQCRTWPFWDTNLKSNSHWERAARTCPGINKGTHYTPLQVRMARAEDRA